MATIFLHIGIHKTGTSSIQQTLHESRPALLERSVNYLPIAINHSLPLLSLFGDEQARKHANVRMWVNPSKRLNARLRKELERALRANRSDKIVISGEGLSSLKRPGVEALKALLDPFADAYRVIAYVRSPASYAVSASQERLKHGQTFEDLEREPPIPGYRRKIEPFIDVFGREAVDIRLFDAGRFAGGRLVSDFCRAIGEPGELADHLVERRMNEAISMEAALVLDALNKVAPRFKDGRHNPERAWKILDEIGGVRGAKFAMPDDFLRRAEQRAARDLAWLHETLGFDPFPPSPRASGEQAPLWGEQAVLSVALRLNELALLKREGLQRNVLRRGVSALAKRLGRTTGRFVGAGPTRTADVSE